MEDLKRRPVNEIIGLLHMKFSQNIASAEGCAHLAGRHEARARKIGIARDYLEGAADTKHRRDIALAFDEVFGDSIISMYFAFCGLDVPSKMLMRRALELGMVLVCYWDMPAEYWKWKGLDEDISFSKLHSLLTSTGYYLFLKEEYGNVVDESDEVVLKLPALYSRLSNVIHPKPYNFETKDISCFSFEASDLSGTLSLLGETQVALLSILSRRFPALVENMSAEVPANSMTGFENEH